MKLRWFGEPWPLPERAPVCEDDAYRVSEPIGKACLYCPEPIHEGQRGVLMAATPDVPGRFVTGITDPDTRESRSVYVVACHIDCLAGAILGPDHEGAP